MSGVAVGTGVAVMSTGNYPVFGCGGGDVLPIFILGDAMSGMG